ncbi:insulin receptor substrate 1 [Calliphora vicina]|uniref:insulin receptor substrate 1 n=1 Tax=Calliphora vicina TaxID=7373 RepID=UPI00325BEB1D
MEIGRQSSLGPGELWMETEDSLTAQNMHRMILSKMISLNEALVEPMRKRSSSATETTNLHHDRKSSQNLDITNNYLLNAHNFSRDRCDSLPTRNRTSSECSNHSIRMMPITSSNRVMNFQISNTSPVVYSASEESVSVDDSEESIGMPHLLSSRSPEGVIPEEYIDDAFHSQKFSKNGDMNSVAALSLDPGSKANTNLIKPCGPAKVTDIKKDICGNIDDQLQFSVRAYSFGGKDENDLTKESIVNRVRAFSVGSRIKSTRICSKTNFKLFNSDNINNDFVESSTRKSISVPVLINRHLQAVDRMADLMEIDFSKSIDKSLKRNIQKNKNECQNASNMLPRSLNISNSIESIDRSIKRVDSGYLEMKPITLASNGIIYNDNNPVNDTGVFSQNRHNFKRKDISIDSTALTDTSDAPVSTPKVTNYLYDKGLIPKDGKNKERTSIPISNLTLSSKCSNKYSDKYSADVINLPQADASCMKQQDLYYASLDLPKCCNEVNTRYSFKESSSDTNIGEVQNEYAKINFVKPETSCSLIDEKKKSFQ